MVENKIDRQVDKLVELTKTVEKPVFNLQVRENQIQKHVDRKVEVPIEKYVEIPKVVEVNKEFEVETRA